MPQPIKKQQNKKTKINFNAGLPVTHPDAAGIDIGHREHLCAVPADRDPRPVRRFGTFTVDLEALADWLKACGIKTVAMESTGVYWIPAFQILDRRGFEVRLVNARQAKNVSGRKTDVQDCQWLQPLHGCGLLNGSFRPADEMCVLRSYLRYRDELVCARTVQCQHMQKALQQMNVQLHQVLSDITGVSGLRMIEAILAGQRDAEQLADLADRRVRANKATIQKAMQGDYRAEHLFLLKKAFELHGIYEKKFINVTSRSSLRWPSCPRGSTRSKRPCPRANRAGHPTWTSVPAKTCARNSTGGRGSI